MSAIELVQKILRRRSHYRRCLIDTGSSGQAVLADLRRFSRFGDSPLVVSNGQTDEFATAVAIGRQEMFSRIVHMLHLDDSQLLRIKEEPQDE